MQLPGTCIERMNECEECKMLQLYFSVSVDISMPTFQYVIIIITVWSIEFITFASIIKINAWKLHENSTCTCNSMEGIKVKYSVNSRQLYINIRLESHGVIHDRRLGLRWLQNAKEINTKNMKCTCRTPSPTPEAQRHLYSTDWRWGLASGVTQITPDARVCVGCKIPTCWYPQRQILALGALPNANPRRQVFCVAVEYRRYLE